LNNLRLSSVKIFQMLNANRVVKFKLVSPQTKLGFKGLDTVVNLGNELVLTI